MAHRTGEPIEAHHDQDLTRLNLSDQPRQHRSTPAPAGSVLLMDHLTTSRAQLVELGVVRLILGGDTSVANQASFEEGRGHQRVSEAIFRPFVHFRSS